MAKSFPLDVNVINGEVQEFSKRFYFNCDQVKPIGETIIRYFNEDMCSVAMKTFYIEYNQNLFGTNAFTTKQQFWDYTNCYPHTVLVLINGCNMKINGRKVIF